VTLRIRSVISATLSKVLIKRNLYEMDFHGIELN